MIRLFTISMFWKLKLSLCIVLSFFQNGKTFFGFDVNFVIHLFPLSNQIEKIELAGKSSRIVYWKWVIANNTVFASVTPFFFSDTFI